MNFPGELSFKDNQSYDRIKIIANYKDSNFESIAYYY